MKILFSHYNNYYEGKLINTYSHSILRELRAFGHEVTETSKDRLPDDEYKKYELLLDIDCGRGVNQNYHFHTREGRVPIKSAVVLIDSHGHADMHEYVARRSDHVFFAVWDKRDLFADHPSTTWLPNFTDLTHFDGANFNVPVKDFDFCFFGTQGGIDRAEPLVKICKEQGWRYDVDEVGRKGKHRWPNTAIRMSNCQFGFNHGQKHDGPNLRVMETMAMKLPLICDHDPSRDGKGFLFEPWQHYIPYKAYSYEGLLERMQWCMANPDKAANIAKQAYDEVCLNHLASHRVQTILEVVQK